MPVTLGFCTSLCRASARSTDGLTCFAAALLPEPSPTARKEHQTRRGHRVHPYRPDSLSDFREREEHTHTHTHTVRGRETKFTRLNHDWPRQRAHPLPGGRHPGSVGALAAAGRHGHLPSAASQVVCPRLCLQLILAHRRNGVVLDPDHL